MFREILNVVRWYESETSSLTIDDASAPQPASILVIAGYENRLSCQCRKLVFSSSHIIPLVIEPKSHVRKKVETQNNKLQIKSGNVRPA
jgi:hypothetical protein